ncbi:MAG: hypothetical protein QXI09_03560 [Candidatus Aenigmatarchaeota archaeon]
MNLLKVKKSKNYYVTSNKSLFFVESKLRECLENFKYMKKEINSDLVKYSYKKLNLYFSNTDSDNIYIYFFYDQFEGTTEIRIYDKYSQNSDDKFAINIIKDILKKLQKSRIEFMPYSS